MLIRNFEPSANKIFYQSSELLTLGWIYWPNRGQVKKIIHYLLWGRRLQVEKNLIILMMKGVEEEEKEFENYTVDDFLSFII